MSAKKEAPVLLSEPPKILVAPLGQGNKFLKKLEAWPVKALAVSKPQNPKNVGSRDASLGRHSAEVHRERQARRALFVIEFAEQHPVFDCGF